jgi:hypothetical protein
MRRSVTIRVSSLLASSQTQTGGLNVIGLQDASLDKPSCGSPPTGDDGDPQASIHGARNGPVGGHVSCCRIAFADEVVVVRPNLQQVVVQPVGDPSDRSHDVLTWRLANDR